MGCVAAAIDNPYILYQMSEQEKNITEKDPLNDLFLGADNLKGISELYLKHADAFRVDQTSGGKAERVEQFIKFLVTLASPLQQ